MAMRVSSGVTTGNSEPTSRHAVATATDRPRQSKRDEAARQPTV